MFFFIILFLRVRVEEKGESRNIKWGREVRENKGKGRTRMYRALAVRAIYVYMCINERAFYFFDMLSFFFRGARGVILV